MKRIYFMLILVCLFYACNVTPQQAQQVAATTQAATSAATQPGVTPIGAIQGGLEAAANSGLVPPPYATWLQIASYVVGGVSVIAAAFQKKKATAATSASTSQAKALQAGIDSGKIVVTAGAAAIVNQHVADHPTTDGLIDVLSAAAKDPIIQR